MRRPPGRGLSPVPGLSPLLSSPSVNIETVDFSDSETHESSVSQQPSNVNEDARKQKLYVFFIKSAYGELYAPKIMKTKIK